MRSISRLLRCEEVVMPAPLSPEQRADLNLDLPNHHTATSKLLAESELMQNFVGITMEEKFRASGRVSSPISCSVLVD